MIQALLMAQNELDKEIHSVHKVVENTLDERFLALLVEIGECLNEWRAFKFWSSNRKPNEKASRKVVTSKKGEVPETYHLVTYNPLMEEYVDGLKFMLSIANSIEFNVEEVILPPVRVKKGEYKQILREFGLIYGMVTNYKNNIFFYTWENIVSEYLLLGRFLGFTNQEIYDGFFQKHKINLERLGNGY